MELHLHSHRYTHRSPDWAAVWPRLGALVAVAVVMGWLATRAFGAYQRSA